VKDDLDPKTTQEGLLPRVDRQNPTGAECDLRAEYEVWVVVRQLVELRKRLDH